MRIDVPRAVVMYLLWLGIISGALLVGLTDALPVSLGIVSPETAFTLLIQAELFFVLVIWPFFVPRLLLPKVTIDTSKLRGIGGEAHVLMAQIGVLIVVALPVALLCSSMADSSPSALAIGHLLVAVAAAFVAALFDVASQRGWRIAPWYAAGLMGVSGLLPLVNHLAEAHGGVAGLRWTAALSPFWAAANLDPAGALSAVPMGMTAVFAVATVALFAAGPWLRQTAAR